MYSPVSLACSLDEEKDLAALSAAAERSRLAAAASEAAVLKSWEDIIPKECLDALKEEQRKKLADELYLGPRQRAKVNNTPTGAPATPASAVNEHDDRYVEKKKRTKRRKRANEDEIHDADYGPAGSAKRKRAQKLKSAETVETDGDSDDDDSDGPSTAAAAGGKKARKGKQRAADVENGVSGDAKFKTPTKKRALTGDKSDERRRKGADEAKVRSTPKGARPRPADGTPSSTKDQRSPDKIESRVRVVPERVRAVQNIKFNVEKYRDDAVNKESPYFSRVVEAFKPVGRYFMRLSGKDVVVDAAEIAKPLRKVGDFIVDYVINMKEEKCVYPY